MEKPKYRIFFAFGCAWIYDLSKEKNVTNKTNWMRFMHEVCRVNLESGKIERQI